MPTQTEGQPTPESWPRVDYMYIALLVDVLALCSLVILTPNPPLVPPHRRDRSGSWQHKKYSPEDDVVLTRAC